jgi:gas vesicle protein
MREHERIVMKGFGGGQMLLAFVTGAAAGAVAALLNAPSTGSETRARLRAAADDARGAAERTPRALREATAAAARAFNEALAEEMDDRRV